MIDADDAVVLLEEALLLRLAPPLQTLDQQAQSPERVKQARQRQQSPHGRPPGAPTLRIQACGALHPVSFYPFLISDSRRVII